MVEIYKNINWIFVYISEAHAIDEWPVQSPRFTHDNQPLVIRQSYDLDSRINLANEFKKNYNFLPRLYISPPDLLLNFEIIYKPWPFRIYGFDGFNISFASEPEACITYTDKVVEWIEK